MPPAEAGSESLERSLSAGLRPRLKQMPPCGLGDGEQSSRSQGSGTLGLADEFPVLAFILHFDGHHDRHRTAIFLRWLK